jgi:uncharacterized protein YbjT (DUF2867 family)
MAPAGRMKAVLIGATGLVGSALLRLLLDDARVGSVAVLGRRATGAAHPKLAEHVVDFDAPAGWSDRVSGDVLLSALGTTLRAAGSAAAQYRVDHDYQLRTAEAARRNGVPAYVLVSASGASPRSRIFYSRMKGELERDAEALGFERMRVLRPGLLDGERRENRPGEGWALRIARPLAPLLPASVRPIRVEIVARAALAAALDPSPVLARYEGRALFALGEGGRA